MNRDDRLGTSRLLASYFDLRTEEGPIHARAVAVMGRRLLDGGPIPAYQSVPPSILRYAIPFDAPHLPRLDDPRDLPSADRTAQWQRLCELLDRWSDLDDVARLRAARVTFKLGFWRPVAALPIDDCPGRDAAYDRWNLRRLSCSARLKLVGEDDVVIPPELYPSFTAAAQDPAAPHAIRISAAINLAVHHARSDRVLSDVTRWSRLAQTVLDSATTDAFSPILRSACWRAVSFMPYFYGDHAEVAEMLDESERLATVGAAEATGDDRLLAAENMRVLYGTRGRAAVGAGNHDAAEHYYRMVLTLDPLDPQAHVALGDYLSRAGRLGPAREAYLAAVRLGAPFTRYATMRAERCKAEGA